MPSPQLRVERFYDNCADEKRTPSLSQLLQVALPSRAANSVFESEREPYSAPPRLSESPSIAPRQSETPSSSASAGSRGGSKGPQAPGDAAPEGGKPQPGEQAADAEAHPKNQTLQAFAKGMRNAVSGAQHHLGNLTHIGAGRRDHEDAVLLVDPVFGAEDGPEGMSIETVLLVLQKALPAYWKRITAAAMVIQRRYRGIAVRKMILRLNEVARRRGVSLRAQMHRVERRNMTVEQQRFTAAVAREVVAQLRPRLDHLEAAVGISPTVLSQARSRARRHFPSPLSREDGCDLHPLRRESQPLDRSHSF